MADASETTLLNQLAHQRHRGTASIVEPHKSARPVLGFKRGQSHVARLCDCGAQWLFTRHMLARLQRGHGHFGVQIIWNTNIYQCNCGVLDQAIPTGSGL